MAHDENDERFKHCESLRANVLPFEERVRQLKRRRPELADKDMSCLDHIDIDAFRQLFPLPPAPPMEDLIEAEHREMMRRLSLLSAEERERLLSSGKGFMLWD